MQYDYDVIVVGGGAGGATFAYACARAGKSVLVLERGNRYTPTSPLHDEKAMLIDKRPYDDREVDVNGRAKRLYMGGVLGGGTSLYGGALVRPSEQDFQPGKYYGKRIPRAIWDWPISYADLEPYYTEAERLYGVAGRGEEDFAPSAKTRRRLSGRASAAPSPQSTADRRQSASRLASLSFAAGDRLVSRACAAAFAQATSVPRARAAPPAQLLERAIAEGLPLKIQTQVEVERLVTERGTRNHPDLRARPHLRSTLPLSGSPLCTGRRRDRIIAALAPVRTGQSADRQKLHDAPVLHRRRRLSSCEQDRIVFCQTGRLRRFLFRHAKLPAQNGHRAIASGTRPAHDGQDVPVHARLRCGSFSASASCRSRASSKICPTPPIA